LRRVLLAILVAGCSSATHQSDWEREHQAELAPADAALVLPAYPRERELVEFLVGPTGEFRFFIDPASISVEKDLVRYTFVARSAGATNVSFEGLRCETGEVRIYAVGRDGGWAGKPTEWRTRRTPWQNALYREYFCPQRQAVPTREDAIRALHAGGYSITRSLSEDIPRGGGAR
jgi:hypothetical protein